MGCWERGGGRCLLIDRSLSPKILWVGMSWKFPFYGKWLSGRDEEKIRESSRISLAPLAQRIAFAPSSLAAPAGRRG